MSSDNPTWNTMTLWDFIQTDDMPSEWNEFFDRKDIREILKNISDQISQSKCTIYPPLSKVFRAFYLPLSEVKAVIIGQDCYHDGKAVGICFSVLPKAPIAPSLANIYKELENEGYEVKKNGNLFHWVKQGCLMLNIGLTVEKSSPESHIDFWTPFSEKLLQYISENTKDVAWILMGKYAAKFKPYADKNGKAFITSHPSPLSAYRGFQSYPGFLGSGIFKNVNSYLEEKGQKKIKW